MNKELIERKRIEPGRWCLVESIMHNAFVAVRPYRIVSVSGSTATLISTAEDAEPFRKAVKNIVCTFGTEEAAQEVVEFDKRLMVDVHNLTASHRNTLYKLIEKMNGAA